MKRSLVAGGSGIVVKGASRSQASVCRSWNTHRHQTSASRSSPLMRGKRSQFKGALSLKQQFDDPDEHPVERFVRKRRRPPASPIPWSERLLGILPYLVPLLDSLVYGKYVFERFPIFSMFVLQPLWPLLSIYRGIPFLPLIIFVLMLVLVVRNPRVSYFVRFNTMQALTLDIALILPQLFQGLSNALPVSAVAIQVLQASVFYGMLGCILYVIQSCGRGQVPDRIPLISEAAHTQTMSGP
jgi:hypothetical protein